MTELQSFQTLASHLISRLETYNCESFLSFQTYEALKNTPYLALNFAQGFIFCLSTYENINHIRQNDDYLDGLFTQLLSF